MSTPTRLQKLNDMRTLLDWLGDHPEVPLPYVFDNGLLLSSVDTRDQLTALARSFGECEKYYIDDSFYLKKRFGSVEIYGFTAREEVCERVVTGTREIPSRVVPAQVIEEVEWRCREPLLSTEDADVRVAAIV